MRNRRTVVALATATTAVSVSLNAGYNVIRLAKGSLSFPGGTGYAELDYIALN